MSGLIVVAVDPATGSKEALRWAAAEARLRQARLHAVMAWRAPRPPAAPAARPPVALDLSPADAQADADARLARMVADALGTGHGAWCLAVHGTTLPVLLTATHDADLLVLDPPRPTDLTRAKASLLAPQLVFRVPCPVVVIPPRAAWAPTLIGQAG
jgi:nucleotide-binding universal stress UspA family protein